MYITKDKKNNQGLWLPKNTTYTFYKTLPRTFLFHYDAKAPHMVQVLAPKNSKPLTVAMGKVSSMRK